MRRVGPSTHAFLQPGGGWGRSNAGLIVGEQSAVLVDTFMDLPTTRELLDAVAGVTPARIETLVNTHHNADHTFGNQLVRGARIVGHERARELMMSSAPPELMAALLAAPDTDGAVGYYKRAFGDFDFAGIEVSPPTVTFTGDHTLELEGRPIRLLYFGPAHTLGDIAAWLPDERVLFAGDLLFLGSTPLVWEGSLSNWSAAVNALLALEPEVVVPGHGPVTGPDGLREMQAYLHLVIAEGTPLLQEGLDPVEAGRRIDLGPYRDWADPERLALNLMCLQRELAGRPPETPVDPFEAFGAMASLEAAWGA